uniref:Secreted protein n=1 Tax=Octopus bimaculoides TaxID=37653 RepID=A0A0L8GE25_OCTBM
MHKRCSNILGRLTRMIAFVCGRCTGAINTKDAQKTDSITCQGEKLEIVDSFHYLSDQVCSGGWMP